MGEVRGVEKEQEGVVFAEVTGGVCLFRLQNGEEAVDGRKDYKLSVAK